MKQDRNDFNNINPKKEAFKITIVYLIVGSLWILFSDEILFRIKGDLRLYKDFQTYKGLAFVVATAIMIFILVHISIRKIKTMNTIIYQSQQELLATNEGLIITQEELYREKILTDKIVKDSTLVVFTWDIDGNILSFNRYAERVTGYTEEEVIGKSWIELFLHEDEKPKVKGLVRYLKSGRSIKNSIGDVWKSKDGRNIELLWVDSPIHDDNNEVTQIISFGTDITGQKNMLKKLNTLECFDTLTGLPNRIQLKNEANGFINDAVLKDTKLAFLYIDIDNFKQVNDTLGYDIGDELLIYLSKIFKEEQEANKYLAKLSEDEYAIILNDIVEEEDIIRSTEEILRKIRKSWSFDKHEFQISVSIGISIFPDNATDFTSLMKYSSMAMYHVKSKGKNGYAFYHDEMGKKIADNTFMINQIKRAIDEEQFSLHYQPIIDIESDIVHGVEVLLRWHHPERGYIPPLAYIPLIEETGQIFDVTSLVLKMAFRQKVLWNEKGYSSLMMAVNISSKSLVKGKLVEEIEGLLKEYNIDPEELIIEITETAFMDNLDDCINTLRELEELGIDISLDDFGTGHSSLSQLKNLPIHYVKMDQEFTKTMKRHSEEEVVVRSIIDLAHTLGLKVVAEGIETKEQKDILTESKCDYGQGYYLARPMNPEEFESRFLKDNKKVKINEQ